jgi:hypothetical protein
MISIEPPCKFPYNPRLAISLACIGFFAACSAILTHEAQTNNRGLLIDYVISLDAHGATVFYWILATFAVLFVLTGLGLIVRRFTAPKMLELQADSLVLPHGFFQSRTTRIHYSEITSLYEQRLSRQTLLRLTTRQGMFSLVAALLPNREIYLGVRDFLMTRVRDSNT